MKEETKTQLNLFQKTLQFEDVEYFVDAVKLMHLTEHLKAGGPFTVFAPTNTAFQGLPEAITNEIADNHNLLGTILQYHILPGKYYSTELTAHKKMITLIGEDVYPVHGRGNVWINEVKLVRGDFEASNGILHFVDGVMVPESLAVYQKQHVEV